jgi:transcriptional repressor NrdR
VRCIYCDSQSNKVLDSRLAEDGRSIRRRRECEACSKRFTTYERCEEVLLLVIKKDGRREKFDRRKILGGLLRACEKRPVAYETLETFVSNIEHYFRHRGDSEVAADDVGTQVMAHLRELDEVAYVRFASVYKEFKDISHFAEELTILEQLRQTLASNEQ